MSDENKGLNRTIHEEYRLYKDRAVEWKSEQDRRESMAIDLLYALVCELEYINVHLGQMG